MDRFICVSGSDNLQISGELLKTLAVDSPQQLHFEKDIIVRVSWEMEKSAWLRLPFCNTLCSEALGAKPVLSLSGARVKEPKYQNVGEIPETLTTHTPRLTAMLRAIEALSEEGGQVAYNIEGPFTVLCALLPMNRVFSALRKPSGVELLQRVENWISIYAGLAVESGAKILSFADPVATVDILGERMFTAVYVSCLKRLLQRLQQEHPEIPIHLCGKLSQCLLDTQTCTGEKWQAEDCRTYGDALTAYCKQGKGGMIGHFCLNFLDAKRPYVTLIEF